MKDDELSQKQHYDMFNEMVNKTLFQLDEKIYGDSWYLMDMNIHKQLHDKVIWYIEDQLIENITGVPEEF